MLKSESIGLPPAGKFHIDVNPSVLASKNQSIKGTLVSGLADVDETLDFARRGRLNDSERQKRGLKSKIGLLRLEPTVVGLSKFNESVQKLRNGEVAG